MEVHPYCAESRFRLENMWLQPITCQGMEFFTNRGLAIALQYDTYCSTYSAHKNGGN